MAGGFLEIAVANMANAIKKISVQRGYDVTRYVLATFGGAGGQHACAVADVLGMTKVLVHPLAGVLSAYGMGLADVIAMRESAVEVPLAPAILPELDRAASELEADALAELAGAGVTEDQVSRIRRAHLRYDGTDTALQVPMGQAAEMVSEFEAVYKQRFSFLMRGKPIVVEAVSVELAGGGEPASQHRRALERPVSLLHRSGCSSRGGWADVPLHRRGEMRSGQVAEGPAIIVEDFATTVVEPGWQATVTWPRRPAAQPRRHAAGRPAHRRQPRSQQQRRGQRRHRRQRRHRGRPRHRQRQPRGLPWRRRHRGGRRRSGAARDLQQPFHVHRRADGGPAAEPRRTR